jgi:hypothetical protein
MCRGTSYLITSFLKEVQHRARTRESSLTSRANVVKAVASVVAAGAAFAPVASPSVTRARRIFIARRLLRGARGRHRCPQVPVATPCPLSVARNQVPGIKCPDLANLLAAMTIIARDARKEAGPRDFTLAPLHLPTIPRSVP